MLILREYNVSNDGKWLILDTTANPALLGVYISSIRISCTGAFNSADTSATVFDALIAEAINEYTGEVIDFTANPTSVRIRLDVSSFNKPFHLFAVAEDPYSSATTCAYKSTIQTATFYKYPLYKAISCAAHEFDGCTSPQHFIEYLMKFKALEASIAVYDVESINSYYDWLILNGSNGYICAGQSTQSQSGGCGCQHY